MERGAIIEWCFLFYVGSNFLGRLYFFDVCNSCNQLDFFFSLYYLEVQKC